MSTPTAGDKVTVRRNGQVIRDGEVIGRVEAERVPWSTRIVWTAVNAKGFMRYFGFNQEKAVDALCLAVPEAAGEER